MRVWVYLPGAQIWGKGPPCYGSADEASLPTFGVTCTNYREWTTFPSSYLQQIYILRKLKRTEFLWPMLY
jgi:hypothetical protein